ncbi:S8 family serine peptidase [Massilia sp. TS11]|uniref:S8 family serine peptidase n=1 Tax=Massilia sp. TS11 TaxID=2908003 RepID=UPI001EDC8379|nr:S8 family serine peptidase [Massilia sp. TS11]MCG2583341.1 S8 family serine peptidase [Massilia sp. TS11]
MATTARPVSQRKSQFLIAARQPGPALQAMNIQPLAYAAIEQALRNSPDIDIVDSVGPRQVLDTMSTSSNAAPGVLVARMTEQKAGILHQQAQGRLVVERDQHLVLHDSRQFQPALVTPVVPTSGPMFNVAISVLAPDGSPVPNADVYVFGAMLPATASTDANGQATLSLFGETAGSISALYIKPRCDYWSYYQRSPDLSPDDMNVVTLRPIANWPALPNFPGQACYGWGQKAMRLDQLPQNYRGQGVRVAIIDSGAATTHLDLKSIHAGFDIINKKTNPQGWTEDSLGHGSHCAGIIAGSDAAFGIRGFAPDAEIHACKLFPGGQISQLIDALEYCIDQQIDVVNLSLGGADVSEALEQQIVRARRAGVACIVAAGNSGGPVQYPASSPNVLAVSAIGKLNEFPADSYHTETLTPFVDVNGFFAAKFSCYGPQIGVCAPGVAIVSSVPSNNFAVWDGTSMAAPHVTGLAALVLAHHPDFQGPYKARSAERVERLFQIIKLSARPINVGDPTRTGLGLPDTLAAVGLQPMAGQAAGMLPMALSFGLAPGFW